MFLAISTLTLLVGQQARAGHHATYKNHFNTPYCQGGNWLAQILLENGYGVSAI